MIVKTKEFSVSVLPPGVNKTALEQFLKRYREEEKNVALLTFDGEAPSKPVDSFDIKLTFTGGKEFQLTAATANSECFESHLYFASKFLNDAGELSEGNLDGTWLLYDLPSKVGKSTWIGITTRDFQYTVFTTGIRVGDEGEEVFAIVEESQTTTCPDPESEKARPTPKKENPPPQKQLSSTESAEPISIIIGYTIEALAAYGTDSIEAYIETFRDDIAQGFSNSSVDSASLGVEFSILPDPFETSQTQRKPGRTAHYTASKYVKILTNESDAGLFKTFHDERSAESANIVVLLVDGIRSFYGEEFCVVDLQQVPHGDFMHELGHVVGWVAVRNPHSDGSQTTGECSWDSIMWKGYSPTTRLNIWSETVKTYFDDTGDALRTLS